MKSANVAATVSVEILILGAGPTGLGAALQLHKKGIEKWLLVDAQDRPGGMAVTEKDEAGFHWDLGGHVIHSSFEAFNEAMALHSDWVHPRRGGWVRVQDQWVPTPIQRNLGGLQDGARILKEMQELPAEEERGKQENLDGYFRANFGETFSLVFFLPFGFKQWAWPLAWLDHSWTSLRAGSKLKNVPEPKHTLEVNNEPEDTSTFPYPRLGTGSLWASVAARLPAHKQRYSTVVEHIDVGNRIAYLRDGTSVAYKTCISTLPLKHLLLDIIGPMQMPELASRASKLLHSTTSVVGLGFTGSLPQQLEGKTWIYSADPEVGFHRATVTNNFSAALSRGTSEEARWSIMFETSTSRQRPLACDRKALEKDAMEELKRWGVISAVEKPISTWYKQLDFGYPLPFLGRDELLATDEGLLTRLEKNSIVSRGRFGGWRYESSNQDYAFVQGIEAVDCLVEAKRESVYWSSRPDEVVLHRHS